MLILTILALAFLDLILVLYILVTSFTVKPGPEQIVIDIKKSRGQMLTQNSKKCANFLMYKKEKIPELSFEVILFSPDHEA
jgi:hypothetical protein